MLCPLSFPGAKLVLPVATEAHLPEVAALETVRDMRLGAMSV